MDKFYKAIVGEVAKVSDIGVLSNVLTIDRYICPIIIHHVRKHNLTKQMCSANMIYLKSNKWRILYDNCSEYNNMAGIKWLIAKNCPCDFKNVITACKYGNIDIIKTLLIYSSNVSITWLNVFKTYNWDESYLVLSAFRNAVEFGDIEIIKLLEQFTARIDFDTILTYCIRTNNMEIVKWGLKNYTKKDWYDPMGAAIETCNMDIINLLKDEGFAIAGHMDSAIKTKNKDIITFMLNNDINISEKKVFINSFGDSYEEKELIEILQWLQNNNYKIYNYYNNDIYSYLANRGFLEAMKWVKENLKEIKVELLKETFKVAAEYGDLNIMKWLLENKFPFNSQGLYTFEEIGNFPCRHDIQTVWNASTFSSAAKNGNLENMKWLLANGCDFDSCTFIHAIVKGDLENLKWLVSNGVLMPNDKLSYQMDIDDAMDYALSMGKIDVIEWLLTIGFKIKNDNLDTYYYPCRSGSLKLIKWLHKNKYTGEGTLFINECCESNRIDGFMDIIKWGYKIYNEYMNSDDFEGFAGFGDWAMIYFCDMIVKSGNMKHIKWFQQMGFADTIIKHWLPINI